MSFILTSESLDCEEYLKMEEKVSCGKTGYMLTYAYPYCSRFFTPEYYSWFDESGEGFLHCTRECLVKKTGDVVEEELKKEVPNCERIEDVAFESHSSCYLQCNFCEACKTNKIALLRTFDFTDLIKPKPFHQVVEIATMCGTQCLY